MKWLDKYNAPKAQNGIEGTMSGLTDKGFNYNGAWGGPSMQKGGSLPGSVGFTYARTNSPAPSEGPYAKKTMPSAQNGQEMKYYQHGLDFKPKGMKNGGWLDGYDVPKAQNGETWMGNKLNNQGIITSETKGGNRISFTGDQRVDDWINKQIDSGKFGFDPKTGGTFPLKKPVKGLSKEDQFVGSKTYSSLVQGQGFNTDAQLAQIKKLPEWQQQIVNNANEKRRKDYVAGNMEEVIHHPLMSPGYFTPEGVAIGALQGAVKLGPDLYEGNYEGAAVDALMALPIGIPAAKKLLPRFTTKQNYTLPEYMSLEAPKGNMYGENQVLVQRQRLLNPDIKAKFFENQAPEFTLSQPTNSLLNFQKTPRDFGNRIMPKNYEDFVNRIHGRTDYDFAASASKNPGNLGVGNYNMPGKVFKDAPLNELGKDIINAHEKNHGIFAGTLSKEMQESLLKPFGTKQVVPHYASKHQADEVLARMGQFKNAVGIGDNQTFNLGHLNLIRKNYAKQFLDNGITEMLAKIKPGSAGEKEFLKNMNKYAFGTGALVTAGELEQKKDGGIIKDDRGQWAHPGEITEINSPYITMQGVPYPVLGISDTGDTKLMLPNKNYKFKGKKVTEYPMAKNGINNLDARPLVKLDQLTNFTNYNKPQPGSGWLSKYN